MMRLVRRGCVLAFVLSSLWFSHAAAEERKPVVEGKGQSGESPTKWAVYINNDSAPGEYIVMVVDLIGTIGKGGILTTRDFYFAGVDGRTLHLYRIEKESIKEVNRHLIMLPLAADNTAVLRVRPIFADRAYTVRLRLGTDNLLSG